MVKGFSITIKNVEEMLFNNKQTIIENILNFNLLIDYRVDKIENDIIYLNSEYYDEKYNIDITNISSFCEILCSYEDLSLWFKILNLEPLDNSSKDIKEVALEYAKEAIKDNFDIDKYEIRLTELFVG